MHKSTDAEEEPDVEMKDDTSVPCGKPADVVNDDLLLLNCDDLLVSHSKTKPDREHQESMQSCKEKPAGGTLSQSNQSSIMQSRINKSA